MSDYALVATKPDPSDPQSPLIGLENSFEGYPLRFAVRPGRREHYINSDDVESGIGSDMKMNIQSLVRRLRFVGQVRESDGVVRTRHLLTLEDFFTICQLNPSPRMDNFRSRVSAILTEIHHTGRYESPSTRVAPPPAEWENDPIIAMRKQQLALEHKVKQVEDSTRTILDTVKGHHHWYALAPWAQKVAGISLSEAEARREAETWLVPRCLENGINPRDHKVHSSKYYQVNSYPEHILWDWAEDYSRRNPQSGFRGRPSSSS